MALHLLFSLLAASVMVTSSPRQGFARADQARLIDSLVRDSAFRVFEKHHPKTGSLHSVGLPPSLAGVDAVAVRFRSGSLRRYGARVKEFGLPRGLLVLPNVRRVVVVRVNLGNLSSAYEKYYKDISGLELVSSVLGLLVYDAAHLANSSTRSPSELEIFAANGPITVDFSEDGLGRGSLVARCASFGSDGKVRLFDQTSRNVCAARRRGHFGLVVSPSSPPSPSKNGSREGRWKVVVAGAVGGVFGVVLLGFLCVAFVSVKKKRRRRVEMERRAYEEEMLQVSMVGHVRAPTAPVARTMPTLENDYAPPL